MQNPASSSPNAFRSTKENDFLELTEVPDARKQHVEVLTNTLAPKPFEAESSDKSKKKFCCWCKSPLARVVLCASLGSFLFGFNIALLNTSLVVITMDFHWCDPPTNTRVLFESSLNTSVFSGAAIGCMTAKSLPSFGRRLALVLSMLFLLIGIIGSTVAGNFASLFWDRIIVGYGIGILSAVVPAYVVEMTGSESRGFYLSSHQFFASIGSFVAILLGLPFGSQPQGQLDENYQLPVFHKVWWRVMLGMGLVPVLIAIYVFLVALPFDTPSYYVENRMEDEARKVLRYLRQRENVEDEMELLIKARDGTSEVWSQGLSFRAIMQQPNYRRVMMVGCMLSACGELTGVTVFVTSSNTLFSAIGFSKDLVTLMSTLLALGRVVMVLPGAYLIEIIGRRRLFILGTFGMGCSLLPGAVLLWVASTLTSSRWVAVLGSVFFMLLFSSSYAPVLCVYLVEVFPVEIRSVAGSITATINWTLQIIMYIVPYKPLRRFSYEGNDRKVPARCRMRLTPLAIQLLSMSAALFCVIFSIFGFINFNLARLVVNIYILVFGLIAFIADVRSYNAFGYIKFMYTPIGRGLLFLLLGCLMLEQGLFQMVSGLVMVAVGIVYFVAARLFGGVPRPLLQRNVEDLPLNTELHFVDSTEEPARSARTAPQGFRI